MKTDISQPQLLVLLATLFCLSFSNNAFSSKLPREWTKFVRKNGDVNIISEKDSIYCLQYVAGKGGTFFKNIPIQYGVIGVINISLEVHQKLTQQDTKGAQLYLYVYSKNNKILAKKTRILNSIEPVQRVNISSEIPKFAYRAALGLSVNSRYAQTTCIDTSSLDIYMTSNEPVEFKGENINTQTWGSPDAPSILLIHGNNQDGMTRFSWLAEKLSSDYFVVAYDQRGFGKTQYSGNNYSFESQIKDLEAVIKKYKLNNIAIIGHSFGARIAIMYAAMNSQNVNRVILEDMDILKRYKQKQPQKCKNTFMNKWGCVANATDLTTYFKSYSGSILVLQADDKKYGGLRDKALEKMKELRPDASYIKIKDSSHFIHDYKNSSPANHMLKIVAEFIK